MAINADTNRVRLSTVKEVTKGTTPTSPVFAKMRYTGSTDLKFEYKTEASKEIIADRQISDLYLTGAESQGGANIEFSIDSYDDLLEGTMANSWSRNIVRNDSGTTLLFASITKITGTTGSIDLDASIVAAPFLDNTILFVDGVGADFSGAIVQVTSTALPAVNFTVLNGKAVESLTTTSISRVYSCGYEFQDVLSAGAGPTTLASATTDMTTLGLNVGQWVKIGSVTNGATDGFDTTADNGFIRILSIDTNLLTLNVVPTGWTADANAGSKKIAIFYDGFLNNGVSDFSFTIERSYLDHSPVDFEYFRGMGIDETNLTNDKQAVVTGSFSFMGLSSSVGAAREAGATDVDAFSTTPFNTVTNINSIRLNGTDISCSADSSGINLATKVDMSIKNNLRGQNAIGCLAFAGTGSGQFDVTGSIDTYFQDTSILSLLNSNVDTNLDVRYVLGKRYMIADMPRVKISSGAPEVSGVNADVTATYGFQALKDPVKLYTLAWSKISTY